MSDIKQLISIIIPVFNESESIRFLLDESTIKIKELSVISLRKNYGQTAAMAAGFDNSKGEIVITLDLSLIHI